MGLHEDLPFVVIRGKDEQIHYINPDEIMYITMHGIGELQ